MNNLDAILKKLRRVTALVKIAPFAVALLYLAQYVFAYSLDDSDTMILFGAIHLPIYAACFIAGTSILLGFCWWHFSLCLMPVVLDAMLYGAEFGIIDWANDLTYTNIIIGLIAWLVLTTFLCYKYGWSRK